MAIKVSIIVPVYNTEEYLGRCLDSILNQTLEEIEIILVNDGSTDNSLSILEEYRKKYTDKIQIINLQEKGGPGGARNAGISIAKGEFVGFVDSDDYIDETMYEKLYNLAIDNNADMVDCAYHKKNRGKKSHALNTMPEIWGKLDLEKRKILIASPGYLWSKIIRRKIIVDNNLKFRERISYEDVDFMRIVILYLNNVYGCEEILYHYEYNEESLSNSTQEEIAVDARITAIDSLVNEFKERNLYDTYRDEITFVVYYTYLDMLKYYTYLPDEENLTYDIFKKLREFFFKYVNYDYHDNEYIYLFDEKDRMYVELNNADYKIILDTIRHE